MNVVLICPSTSPAVEHLAPFGPLAGLPLLGESLVEYWLAHLALSGARQVKILAHERPEAIEAIVGNGTRWGLEAAVIKEARELTPAQAQLKYIKTDKGGVSTEPVVLLDHFPGCNRSLFRSYADLFSGVFEWLPKAKMPDRIGFREVRPGIWAGSHAKISPEAKLEAPCWIGQNVYVGPKAVLGPRAIVENRAFIEPTAEIVDSMVGPDTFVGEPAALYESIAWGDTLINWKSGLATCVADSFLLCALRRPAMACQSDSFFTRLADIYTRNKDDIQMFWKHFLINRQG